MVEAFTTAVQTLGFPIACVLGLAWFVFKMYTSSQEQYAQQIKEIREDSKEREQIMYNQIEKFSETLNNFNSTLIRIDARVEGIENILSIHSEEEGEH
jgi:predicted nucleic-acid-binding protein